MGISNNLLLPTDKFLRTFLCSLSLYEAPRVILCFLLEDLHQPFFNENLHYAFYKLRILAVS